MSTNHVSGYSKLSRVILWCIAPLFVFLLIGIWAIWLSGGSSSLSFISQLLQILLIFLIGASLAGMVLGIIGKLRRDDAPTTGLVCALSHGALVMVSSITLIISAWASIDASTLAIGIAKAPGTGVTLSGGEGASRYKLQLPAPWQEIPAEFGVDKMATRGDGVVLSVRGSGTPTEISRSVTQSLEEFEQENPKIKVLGSRSVLIDGREWVRFEFIKDDNGVAKNVLVYLYGGKEGTYRMTCMMPANVRNKMEPLLTEGVSEFRFLGTWGPETRSDLVSRAEKLLRDGKIEEAWELVHNAPESESAGLVSWLTENQQELDARFWFEIPRRLTDSDYRAAVWHWLRARIHTEYEVRRLRSNDMGYLVSNLERDICPTLPEIAKQNRLLTKEVAEVVLIDGVMDRTPRTISPWMINQSNVLTAVRERQTAAGEKFDVTEWLAPEERAASIRDVILEEYRKKYAE